jgi:hypothetical protein
MELEAEGLQKGRKIFVSKEPPKVEPQLGFEFNLLFLYFRQIAGCWSCIGDCIIVNANASEGDELSPKTSSLKSYAWIDGGAISGNTL